MSRKHKHPQRGGGSEQQEKQQLDRIEKKLDQDIALDQQILAGQGNKAVKATLVITPNN